MPPASSRSELRMGRVPTADPEHLEMVRASANDKFAQQRARRSRRKWRPRDDEAQVHIGSTNGEFVGVDVTWDWRTGFCNPRRYRQSCPVGMTDAGDNDRQRCNLHPAVCEPAFLARIKFSPVMGYAQTTGAARAEFDIAPGCGERRHYRHRRFDAREHTALSQQAARLEKRRLDLNDRAIGTRAPQAAGETSRPRGCDGAFRPCDDHAGKVSGAQIDGARIRDGRGPGRRMVRTGALGPRRRRRLRHDRGAARTSAPGSNRGPGHRRSCYVRKKESLSRGHSASCVNHGEIARVGCPCDRHGPEAPTVTTNRVGRSMDGGAGQNVPGSAWHLVPSTR